MSLHRRAILLLLLSAPALAQTRRQSGPTVYRCGPQGREIRDRPCPESAGASAPTAFDEPSAQDRRAARERQAADAREATRLQQERERFEAGPSAAASATTKTRRTKAASAGRRKSKKREKARDEKTRTVRAPESGS